jgi:fructan beta-fructosidase
MNDPNGLVYFNDRWHLFYQYNPYGDRWGHMHWGHAESTDLIRWRRLPVALFPDRLGTIFSGSVVADHRNTSGLFPTVEGGLAAVFTYFKWGLQRQGIATSTDGGLTWKKYPGNPVVKNPLLIHFRDPKVFYHGPTGRWVMLLTVGGRIRFSRSQNLLDWEPTGEFGRREGGHAGVWECPDLFELAMDGNNADKKWVLLVSVKQGAPGGGSGTQYFLGDFDGRRFTADHPADRVRWLDFGADNYAGITYNNVPEKDGRRIFIGWMSNWDYAQKTPTAPWRGAMTIPRELRLAACDDEVYLVSQPVGELAAARRGGFRLGNERIDGERMVQETELSDGAFEIVAEWEAAHGADFGIALVNDRTEETVIGCDLAAGRIWIDRTRSSTTDFSRSFSGQHAAPFSPGERSIDVRILVDRCSVEVFADGGRAVITDLVFPSAPYDRLRLFSVGGAVTLSSLSGWRLDPR